jgi:hypothetical protein
MKALSATSLRIEPLPLPFAEPPAIAAARPGGASILALVARDGSGRLLGVAAGRRRRSADVLRLTAWEAEDDCAAILAEAFVEAAREQGVLAIRATDDLAAAAFCLQPTGRGYVQRWLGTAIPCDPRIGVFTQTTGFTCGPVSLAMALHRDVTRHQEIALWREATTVIGLTGPGGCDPYGLALAAARRIDEVTLYIDTEEPVLLDRADTPEKRELMRFVQGEFKAAAQEALKVIPRVFRMEELRDAVAGGAQVMLLVDQCHTHDHSAPHWVLLHAVAGDVFLVNDPWMEVEDGEVSADCDCLPMLAQTLWTMGSYGNPPYRAAIVLKNERR